MNSHHVKRRNLPEGAVGRVSVPCNTKPGTVFKSKFFYLIKTDTVRIEFIESIDGREI